MLYNLVVFVLICVDACVFIVFVIVYYIESVMSVQRHRKSKSEVRGTAGGRGRGVKPSGDTLEVVRPQGKTSSKSKTKIPSNLRYDLETALVGVR